MIQFQVDEKRPDILEAIHKLDDLAGPGEINVRQITIVETENQDVADILKVMLGPGRIGGKQDFMRPVDATTPVELVGMRQRMDERLASKPGNGNNPPAPPKTSPPAPLQKMARGAEGAEKGNSHQAKARICKICGDIFVPTGRSQKVCAKLECKRAIQKQYNQKYLSRKKIRAAVPEMEVPADAPGPLSGIQMGEEHRRPMTGMQMGGE